MKISTKNTKLGNIYSFSLPAITTCAGATKICKKYCYAYKLENRFPNVKKAYTLNMNSVIENESFTTQLIAKLSKDTKRKKNPLKIFRFHVSGDILNIKYLYNMISIVKSLPTVSFYAYTKNWSLPNWLPHLYQLKNLPNFTLFASVDDCHISNNLLPPNDFKIAYVGDKSISDISNILNRKFVTCANQKVGITCETCKICFTSKLKQTNNSIYFIKH